MDLKKRDLVGEHADDDAALLKEFWDKAPAGAVHVTEVLALKVMWIAHDDDLEHCRRYAVSSQQETTRAAEVEPAKHLCFFDMIAPLAVVVGWLKRNVRTMQSDMRPDPWRANGLISSLKTVVIQWNRLTGLTVDARLEEAAG